MAVNHPFRVVLMNTIAGRSYHIIEWQGASGEWYARQTYMPSEARVFDLSNECDRIEVDCLIPRYGYMVKAVQP